MNKASENPIGFTGPIFIVGIPRSGTKLLRDLLNLHPAIFIPDHESHFIPYVERNYKNVDLSNITKFRKFYLDLNNTDFFRRLKKKSIHISLNEWFEQTPTYTISDIIETLFRQYALIEKKSYKIWGDKSPDYIAKLSLLKKLFPQSKFIHIIRDGRDVCLSTRKVWGKNIYRTAQRWNDDVLKCRNDGNHIFSDYFEIKYETLITEPEKSLCQICEFIGIEFYSEMLHLTKCSENYGDARGKMKIVDNNTNKFLGSFSAKELRRIESIIFPALKILNYSIYNKVVHHKPLTASKMCIYKILDAIALIQFNIKKQGIIDGLRYFISGQVKK